MAGNTLGAQWTPKGKVGRDLTVEQGYQAARQAGLIMLAKVRAALGSLDRVQRVVKVVGVVNSADDFVGRTQADFPSMLQAGIGSEQYWTESRARIA